MNTLTGIFSRKTLIAGGAVLTLLVAFGVWMVNSSSDASATGAKLQPIADVSLGNVQEAPTKQFSALGPVTSADVAELRPEVQQLLSSVTNDFDGPVTAMGVSPITGGHTATIASVGDYICAATDGGGPRDGMGATCGTQKEVSKGETFFVEPASSGDYAHVVGLVANPVKSVRIDLENQRQVVLEVEGNVVAQDLPPVNGVIVGLDQAGNQLFRQSVPIGDFSRDES